MSGVKIKSLMEFSESDKGINCSIDGSGLWILEKILSLIADKYSTLKDFDFFEFGSGHYSIFKYGLRTGLASQFMGIASGLDYSCFDANSKPEDIDIMHEYMVSYKLAPKEFEEEYAFKDKRFNMALERLNSLDMEPDLKDNFLRNMTKEYYEKYFGFYERVDISNLKEEIAKFAVNEYALIVNKINDSQNPLIFSHNVVTAPKFSSEFPFLNIEKGVHVHSGGINDYLVILGLATLDEVKDWYFKPKINRDILVDRFKEKYALDNRTQVSFEEISFNERPVSGIFYWSY